MYHGGGMVNATTEGRNRTLDVVRGFAVLGILLANIAFLAGPALSTDLAGELEGIPMGLQDSLTTLFVSGKFRSTLAILFGLGIYLQFQKMVDTDAWPVAYLKRNAVLALIGLVHGILIWWGDILFLYSLVAFFICLTPKWSNETIKWLIGIGLALALLIGAGATLAYYFTSGQPSTMGDFGFGIQDEQRIFQTGSFAEITAARAVIVGLGALLGIVMYPMLGPLFLIGGMLARSGALAAPSQHAVTRNWMLGIGFGFGLPLHGVAILLGSMGYQAAAGIFVETIAGPVMALGYAMGVAVLAERYSRNPILNGLQAVGKVSLTVYLLQSVICTTIFYSFGFRLFGTLPPEMHLVVVAGVWTACVAFALAWTRFFVMGPVEWFQRSLTAWKRYPMRRPPKIAPAGESL